jgi:hypothetical protein
MTTLADFSTEQAQLLTETPFAVGMAVMAAGRSGLGTVKEAAAVTTSVLAGRQTYANDALIQTLISSLEAQVKADRAAAQRLMNPFENTAPDQFLPAALDRCRQVAELLAAKASAEESAHFKQWLRAIADKVAGAAKEGDFLGIGGVRVSEAEADAMRQIGEALG